MHNEARKGRLSFLYTVTRDQRHIKPAALFFVTQKASQARLISFDNRSRKSAVSLYLDGNAGVRHRRDTKCMFYSIVVTISSTMVFNTIAPYSPLLQLRNNAPYPMTTFISSGKSYSGTSRFRGAGPFRALPDTS